MATTEGVVRTPSAFFYDLGRLAVHILATEGGRARSIPVVLPHISALSLCEANDGFGLLKRSAFVAAVP